MCYQCDTEKLTKEFRWCHTCNRSVCSNCFIDRHINADGIGLHYASKWDSLMGVKTTVSRLKQMSRDNQQIVDKCKMDVTNYLDGLNIYLTQKIDVAGKVKQQSYASMADKIANAYGINKEEISTSNPIPEKNFHYALKEATKVAQLDSLDANLADVHFQVFPYEQLQKSFLNSNISPPLQSCHSLLTNLETKLINTEFVGLDKVFSPIDFVVLGSDEAIILDATGPYHYCNSASELIQWKLKLCLPLFERILVMPHNRDLAMVTGFTGASVYFFLTKNSTNKYKQWQNESGQIEWSLPSDPKVVASTENVYTFNHNSLYVYDHVNKLDFHVIFRSTYKHAQFTELCNVQEDKLANTTDFYLFGNPDWQQLEVIQLDKVTKRLICWRSVNLSMLCPDFVFAKPMICAYGISGLYLVWDQESTELFNWNVNTNDFNMIAALRIKSPHVIQFHENSMYAICMTMSEKMNVRRVERIKL